MKEEEYCITIRNNFLRTVYGRWLNMEHIKTFYIKCNEEKSSIFADGLLVRTFSSEEEAQKSLDELMDTTDNEQ